MLRAFSARVVVLVLLFGVVVVVVVVLVLLFGVVVVVDAVVAAGERSHVVFWLVLSELVSVGLFVVEVVEPFVPSIVLTEGGGGGAGCDGMDAI